MSAETTDAHVVSVHTPEEVVLVVDFGAQYAQLIRAPRARGQRLLRDRSPHDHRSRDRGAQSRGDHPLGWPQVGARGGCPGYGPWRVRPGRADSRHLLRLTAHRAATRRNGHPGGSGEYGRTILHVDTDASGGGGLLAGLPANQTVWMSHFDAISVPPEGFTATASSEGAPVAALEDPDRRIWGVQFHPEVHHTPHGQEVIARFLVDLAGCSADWTMANFVDDAVADIRAEVGDGRAICGLSGGVDSAVAAALVHRAIGPQLTCVFVDTGLMRKNEGDQVVETFRRHQGIELIHVHAGDRFFERLSGLTDPEEKRKAIGELFIRVFEDAKGGITDARYLVQGTLYPDVIESGTAPRVGDQEPPQRRWTARRPRLRAGGASADSVQG